MSAKEQISPLNKLGFSLRSFRCNNEKKNHQFTFLTKVLLDIQNFKKNAIKAR